MRSGGGVDRVLIGLNVLSEIVHSLSVSLRRQTVLSVVLLASVLVGWPAAARADGDPASDVLASQSAFVPSDSGASIGEQAWLARVLSAAARRGYPIRVALIASASDLGSVTALWRQPQNYAHFLWQELSFAVHARVLVVMPGGMGLYDGRRPTAGEQAVLARSRPAATEGGLVSVAATAVEGLAAAAGHPLPADDRSSHGEPGGGLWRDGHRVVDRVCDWCGVDRGCVGREPARPAAAWARARSLVSVTEPVGALRWLRAATAIILSAVLVAGSMAPAARADGDPGSDVLVYQDLFTGSAGLSVPQQLQFSALLKAAARAGFPVRVAIIASPSDLGAVTSLWRNPRAYAKFLGLELSLAYKQRLLVVMPNGLGFSWPKHSTAPAYELLRRISIGSGGNGLLSAAQTAVQQLAKANGVKLPSVASEAAAGSPGAAAAQGGRASNPGRATDSGVAIVVFALAALVLAGVAVRWALRRRGASRRRADAASEAPAAVGDQP